MVHVWDDVNVCLARLRDISAKPLALNETMTAVYQGEQAQGTPAYYHARNRAVDIVIEGWTPSEVLLLVAQAGWAGFRGVGVQRSWLHLDTGNWKIYEGADLLERD